MLGYRRHLMPQVMPSGAESSRPGESIFSVDPEHCFTWRLVIIQILDPKQLNCWATQKDNLDVNIQNIRYNSTHNSLMKCKNKLFSGIFNVSLENINVWLSFI